MRVSGDNEIGLTFQSAGEEFIIGRIICNFVSGIKILGNNRFSENQPKEPSDGLFLNIKLLPDSWIMKHTADLLHNLDGGDQLEGLFNPKILELGG